MSRRRTVTAIYRILERYRTSKPPETAGTSKRCNLKKVSSILVLLLLHMKRPGLLSRPSHFTPLDIFHTLNPFGLPGTILPNLATMQGHAADNSAVGSQGIILIVFDSPLRTVSEFNL